MTETTMTDVDTATADVEFDQYAVGWEALVPADADPMLDESWEPVYSVQIDRQTAENMTHQLREVHRLNPTIRNVELFGRPAVPSWENLNLAVRPIWEQAAPVASATVPYADPSDPVVEPPPVVEDQAPAAEPEPAVEQPVE